MPLGQRIYSNHEHGRDIFIQIVSYFGNTEQPFLHRRYGWHPPSFSMRVADFRVSLS